VTDTDPAHVAGGHPRPISASFDVGSSGAVVAVSDPARARADPRGPLAADAAAAALRFLQRRAPGGAAPAIALDLLTERDPVTAAEAWRRALGRAPLERHGLRTVVEDGADPVMDGDPAAPPGGTMTGRVGGAAWRRLSAPGRPGDGGGTNEDVLADAFTRLAGRAAARAQPGRARRFDRGLLTHPTTLPPDRRDRLTAAAAGVARTVERGVPEAAAVAGFHLMRRFGDDVAVGAEAFRLTARAPGGRRAWEDPETWSRARTWHENWLVVVVGGGTTDCARLRVALVDRTAGTDPTPGARAYAVSPRIVSSGGLLELGGDELTLEVFRHLDRALGTGAATRPDGANPGGRGAGARDVARLWDAAEKVKRIGLARAAPAAVRVRIGPSAGATTAATVSTTLTGDEVVLPGLEGDPPTAWETTVSGADLAGIAEPALRRIAALAAGIAGGAAPPGADREIDLVVLSGGSMLAGHLRTRLEDELRARFEADGLGPAFDLAFDPGHATTATALGALYLHSGADQRDGPGTAADGRTATGTRLDVDISRLRADVAADFDVHAGGTATTVFRRGDPLVDGGGAVRTARSRFFAVKPQVLVHRVDYSRDTSRVGIEWGAYGLTPAQFTACTAAGVRMAFEIDDAERVTVILRKGPAPGTTDAPDPAPGAERPPAAAAAVAAAAAAAAAAEPTVATIDGLVDSAGGTTFRAPLGPSRHHRPEREPFRGNH
jgi:hypothetical protein